MIGSPNVDIDQHNGAECHEPCDELHEALPIIAAQLGSLRVHSFERHNNNAGENALQLGIQKENVNISNGIKAKTDQFFLVAAS